MERQACSTIACLGSVQQSRFQAAARIPAARTMFGATVCSRSPGKQPLHSDLGGLSACQQRSTAAALADCSWLATSGVCYALHHHRLSHGLQSPVFEPLCRHLPRTWAGLQISDVRCCSQYRCAALVMVIHCEVIARVGQLCQVQLAPGVSGGVLVGLPHVQLHAAFVNC